MIYNYLKDSFEFSGVSAKEFDPLEGAIMLPANATVVEPLPLKIGFVSCFDDVTNSWRYVVDGRGEYYSTETGEGVAHDLLGDVPANLTSFKKGTAFDVWNGSVWITDLEAMRASFKLDLNNEAEGLRYKLLGGVGQAMTYKEKEKQAREFQAVNFIGDVPDLIYIDVDAGLAADVRMATLAVIAAADYARARLTLIEGVRRVSGAAIAAAVGVDELLTLKASYIKSLGAL